MVKKNKIVFLLASFLFFNGQLANAETKSDLKVTAKVEKTCLVSANDVNFGILNSPLTEQSANSEMKVLCSKDTLYTIDLKYGVSSTGSGSTNNVVVGLYATYDTSKSGYITNYYTINGKFEGGALYCRTDGGLWFSANQHIVDSNLRDLKTNESKVCNPDGTINLKNTENLFNNNVNTDYGEMVGVTSKDLMAYKFTLPNDSTQIWKLNFNSFASVGTGTMQTITMNAKILPENSSSKYLAQDTYIDSVIAEFSY